ncbi:MAG: metalloregulator ArsR/SmtB family transcription factor [Hyphomicrobiaceae bacterium]|nr:metalloregulator ArsR/SmtB family transcription factor [Hyphomicrobiaceae bacterium]
MGKSISEHLKEAQAGGETVSPELRRLMQNARDASDFLKALAHENRLVILCLLAERERSVTELEELLSLSQATVSQQLARLRFEGLVASRRDGRQIYYSLPDETTRRFIRAVYDKFCG